MVFESKWSRILSNISRLLFFLLIILQVPLFRVPCRGETCTTSLELIYCHLIATEIWPSIVAKSLMYPGAFVKAILKDKTIPDSINMLQLYPFIRNRQTPNKTIDLNRVEVLVGSYLTVGGAFLGCLRPGRMSLAGILLIVWGLKKDFFLRIQTSTNHDEAVSVHPTMLFAIILSFGTIKGDVRKLIRCFRHHTKMKHY